jgi:hypothetical protein
MKGNKIIVSGEPRGRYYWGPVTGTPRPGTIMQIDVSEGLNDDGNFTFEAFDRADGGRSVIFVLLERELQGIAVNTSTSLFPAYVAGDEVGVYVPAPGEELNVMFGNIGGTGDDVTFGEYLMVDATTNPGMLIDPSSEEIEPFQALEAYTDPTADKLIHVIYTGN